MNASEMNIKYRREHNLCDCCGTRVSDFFHIILTWATSTNLCSQCLFTFKLKLDDVCLWDAVSPPKHQVDALYDTHVLAFIKAGKRIDAIKRVRDLAGVHRNIDGQVRFNMSLKEGKKKVEYIEVLLNIRKGSDYNV